MKKSVLSIIVASGMGTAAFSMDDVQNVFVDYSPQTVDVKKMQESIVVTPKTDQLVINYKAYFDSGSHFLNIAQSEENISSPSIGTVRDSQLQRLIWQNPTQLKVRSDFTLNPFISTESYHVIHNAGYLIAGNAQTYVKSTFAFENNGAIKLNPSSPVAQQLQTANPPANPLASLLFGLMSTHLSPNEVYTTHQAVVNPECSIASITARPYGGIKREAPINGTVSYGNSFKMDLSVSGIILEFQPNKGFKFELFA